MPDLKLYTVAQVRDWLERNIVAEGLTNEVIRPVFAYALIHNPYVKDDDPIISAIYDDGILAASNCAYPEIFEQPRCVDEKGNQRKIWWFPMLWVKPEFRGKAYGLVSIGSLAEIYGVENAWTAWAVPETIEIFEYLGCKTYYVPRFFMGEKSIDLSSIKGYMALMKNTIQTKWHRYKLLPFPNLEYQVRYSNHVNGESYHFMEQHKGNHLFFPSMQTINWELQYPTIVSAPLVNRVPIDCDFFSDVVPSMQRLFVQIWRQEKLLGVYRLRIASSGLSCDTIYYEENERETVFASIVEHIQSLKIKHFDTEDETLANYIRRYVYFPSFQIEQLSLSVSTDIDIPEHVIR